MGSLELGIEIRGSPKNCERREREAFDFEKKFHWLLWAGYPLTSKETGNLALPMWERKFLRRERPSGEVDSMRD